MRETKTPEGPSTALVPVRNEALAAYEPRSYEEALRLATHYAKSGLLGNLGQDAVLLIMATGAEMNIPPTAALRSIHVVKGKPILSADLMVALCQKRPDICEYFKCVESTDARAVYETKRRGDAPVQSSFTIEDAKRAKLGLEWDQRINKLVESSDSNWAKYPRTMLRKRAAAELARQVYPDIVLGLYSDSEEEEIARDVTPAPTPQIVAQPLSGGSFGGGGGGVVQLQEAELVGAAQEATEDPTAALLARWRETLSTCRTSAEADKVLAEVAKRFPDKKAPERTEINALYRTTCARLGAGQKPAAPQQEIPIDKKAEPRERVPGEDDDK